MEAFRKYSVSWYERVENTFEYDYAKKGASFLDVMAEVILSNRSKSLKQLGVLQAIKALRHS